MQCYKITINGCLNKYNKSYNKIKIMITSISKNKIFHRIFSHQILTLYLIECLIEWTHN